MTGTEIKTVLDRLDKNDADHLVLFRKIDELMGEVREVTKTVGNWREWRARVEGMVAGGRLTLTILGLLVGLLGGAGIGLVVK